MTNRAYMFTLMADTAAGEDIAWPLCEPDAGPLRLWPEKCDKIRYMAYQVERCPTTKRVHLQRYAIEGQGTKLLLALLM